jgi:spore maturation protein SpmA
MLNYIWLGMILVAVLAGGFNGKLPEVTAGAFKAAQGAVMDIALPLVGIMAIWLGIMRLAEQSGLVQVLARALRPVMRRLFPDVPADHPAMGSMLMNIAANMLGLGNAATPLGLRAMSDLEKLNTRPGVATNAMCTFLAINTSSVQLIPTTAIGILAIAGAKNPTAIVSTAFLATCCAACAGIVSAKFLEKLPIFRVDAETSVQADSEATAKTEEQEVAIEKITTPALTSEGKYALAVFVMLFALMFVMLVFSDECNALLLAIGSRFHVPPAPPDMQGKSLPIRSLYAVSLLAVPFMLSFFPLYAALRRVKVYEQFVEGAKEAFNVALRIIPFLVAMLVAIRMLRDAGVIEMLAALLSPVLNVVGFPADVLPVVLMRPLSGSATMGIFTDVAKHFGGDHFNSRLAATIFGSTETTFYVLAVYFGAVSVRKTRHAIAAGLIADLTGVIASLIFCRLMFS